MKPWLTHNVRLFKNLGSIRDKGRAPPNIISLDEAHLLYIPPSLNCGKGARDRLSPRGKFGSIRVAILSHFRVFRTENIEHRSFSQSRERSRAYTHTYIYIFRITFQQCVSCPVNPLPSHQQTTRDKFSYSLDLKMIHAQMQNCCILLIFFLRNNSCVILVKEIGDPFTRGNILKESNLNGVECKGLTLNEHAFP